MRHKRKLGEIGGHAARRAAAHIAFRPLCRDCRRDDSARNSWRACRAIVSLRSLCAPTHYVEKAGQKHCGSELNLSRTEPRELRHKNWRDALFASRLLRREEPSFRSISPAQAFEVASAMPPISAPSANLSSHGVTSPPITNHNSQITAFLIDTLAIRIEPKSFNYIARLHSNRHSSGPWKLHHNCADSPSRGWQFLLRLPGPSPSPTPDLGTWFRGNFQPSSGLPA